MTAFLTTAQCMALRKANDIQGLIGHIEQHGQEAARVAQMMVAASFAASCGWPAALTALALHFRHDDAAASALQSVCGALDDASGALGAASGMLHTVSAVLKRADESMIAREEQENKRVEEEDWVVVKN